MNIQKLIFLTLIGLSTVLVNGCKTPDEVEANGSSGSTTVHEESSDYVWNSSDVVPITLNGTSITVGGNGATASGSKVTITSAGTYSFSGSLSNGQIVVNTTDDGVVRLILSGVTITTSNSAPIYVKDSEKTVIVLDDNTTNTLTDGTTYVYDVVADQEPDAAIFSKSDLTIFGNGSLTVNGQFGDAIVSKDGLIIKSGNITINAADDGIRGKDYLIIDGGTLNITSKADGLKSSNDTDASLGYVTINDGTIAISAGDDGIHAETNLVINNGTITISKSYEGLEGATITINDGTIHLTSSDDGVNVSDGSGETMGSPMGGSSSNSSLVLTINGGYLYVNATGDGLDSNGSIVMTGGTVLVNGPTSSNNGPLDYDGSFKISGGLLVAVGSSGMAQAPGTTSTQNSVLIKFSSNQSANSLVNIQSADGTSLLTFKPVKQYQSLAFSSPNLTQGTTYKVYTGGSSTGTGTDGLFTDGTYTAGTQYTSFTASSVVTNVSSR